MCVTFCLHWGGIRSDVEEETSCASKDILVCGWVETEYMDNEVAGEFFSIV